MNDYLNLESANAELIGGSIVAPEGGEGTLIDPLREEDQNTERRSRIEFGHSMLKYFAFAPGYVNLNNGGFIN